MIVNRLSHVTDWSGKTVTYTYTARNQVISQTNANDTSTTYAYDATGRLVQIDHNNLGGSFENHVVCG